MTRGRRSDGQHGVPKALRDILNKRLIDEGHYSCRDFMNKSGVPYSVETVRRAFNECSYKNLDTVTLAVIMKHLGYSPKEIKDLLRKHIDSDRPEDIAVIELIGDQEKREYSIQEENLIEIYRAIIKKKPELSTSLADHLELLSKIAGIRITNLTDTLRK